MGTGPALCRASSVRTRGAEAFEQARPEHRASEPTRRRKPPSMLDFESQEERFRQLQAEMQELRERILEQVEIARRHFMQIERDRANRRRPRHWIGRAPHRPTLR